MKLTAHTALAFGIMCCLGFGVLAEGWSLLAAQSVDSPWKFPGFETFCEHLAHRSWWIALLTLVQWPFAEKGGVFSSAKRSWLLVGLWLVGAILCLGAMAYASATGIRGVQLRNSGQLGYSVMLTRVFGELSLLTAWVLAVPSIWRGLNKGLC